jgi:hypothetical protein
VGTVPGFSAISFPNATQKCEVRQVEEQGKKLLVRIDLFWKIQGQASLIFLRRPWLEAWGSNLEWPMHTGREVSPSGLKPNSRKTPPLKRREEPLGTMALHWKNPPLRVGKPLGTISACPLSSSGIPKYADEPVRNSQAWPKPKGIVGYLA